MSMKKVKVDVTGDDIRVGRRFNESSCPVALAISRAIGIADRSDIKVNQIQIELYLDGIVVIDTPDSVAGFINSFDWSFEGREDEIVPRARPFSFEIEVPDTTKGS